jgi:transcriptional regulator with XRE-family HTH domain
MKQFNPGKIAERRKKLRKTQFDVAKEAGLSLASISYIENGLKMPRANTLIRLANALKCKVDYFFVHIANHS